MTTSGTMKLIPSSYSLSSTNTSYISIDNASNMYSNTSSTTYATINNNRSGSTTSYYCYIRGFNLDSLPEHAEVSSFTIRLKGYQSGCNTGNNYRPILCNNTTTISNTYANALGTSASTVTFANGSLTWDTIMNYGSNFGIRVCIRRNDSNTAAAAYIYGAEIEVNYIVPEYYSITATSAIPNISVTPTSQNLREGSNTTITFDIDDIDGYIVEDNSADVTSSLVRYLKENSSMVSRTADSMTTGFSGGTSINFYTSSSATGNNFNYAVGHTAESPGSTSSGSGSWTYVKDNGNSTNYTGYADFVFDFSSIPQDATISIVEVKCYGAVESASQSTSHADITLFSGTTQKGTMQKFTSSTNSIITISDPGAWTRAELQSAKLRFAVGYYGGHIFGITWNVTYTVPSNEHYYTYTLSNISASHVILLDEASVYIPPEEDPEYTYQSLTISSINATTNPSNGTTRVIEGSNQTITITPTDPQLTLALDNGIDITSQLQGGIPNNTYTVTTQVSGASYGFNLNNNTGYYVSTNNGVAKSASVARINMNFESECLVTIQYINYAEATYDYGLFGKLDTAVATNGLTAGSNGSSPSDATSNYQLMCNTSAYNLSTAQTLTYNVPSGSHFIDVKYGKDDASDDNNDTLQWKVLSVESTSGGGAYTYTLTNITQKHNLIFVFGDVTYYYITSSGPATMRLFPDGQQVVLENGGYKVVSIPANLTDVISLTDNNVDVTNNLEVEEGEDRQGSPVINYIYRLTNIQANHTLAFSATSGATDTFYIKRNGSWIEVSKIYLKVNNAWVEQRLDYLSTNNIQSLVQG